VTTHKLENIGCNHKTWTVLPHSPYNPHPAASNFQLFGALKDAINGERLGSDDEVIEKVKKWLCVQI